MQYEKGRTPLKTFPVEQYDFGWRRHGIGARCDNHGGGRGDNRHGVQYAARGSELGQASGAGLAGAGGASSACGKTRSFGGVRRQCEEGI